jgi:heterodisulfide reductase subunit B
MKIGYYPGCSLHSTGVEYDISTKTACEVLGIELDEIKDWICCGSSPAHQCDELMSVALPAKNLSLAEKGGLTDICAPCASCYSRLKDAQDKMKDEQVRKDVEEVLATDAPGDIEVLHALDMFVDRCGYDAIGENVEKELEGLKVACYYGCLMTRPPKITGKTDFENPTAMEELIETLGGETVDWNLKTFCCGASFALTNLDVVLELTKKILADAEASGANAIAVGCPLCQANLDGRQIQINEKYGTEFNIPIFYFTELMSIAFGVEAGELALAKHITEVEGFLEERSLL